MMPSDGRPLVALRMPQGPSYRAALEAVWATGAAVLPVGADLPDTELRTILGRMRPARLVSPEGTASLPGSAPVAEDTDVVVLTSGSTGLPKGVELSRSALTAAARMTTDALGADPGDRWLCCVPITRIAGLSILVRSAHLDSEPVVLERFDRDRIARERDCDFVSLVPTMLHRLLEAEVDLSGFKAILLGGAPAAVRLVQRARAARANVIRTYGMTETCGGIVYEGRPLPGVDVSVDTSGAIRLRAPSVMQRYRLDPDLTESVLRDGWYRTGDVGTFEEGRLTIMGREDDAIVTGGEKVFPLEVEHVLLSHPDIDAARVTGEPDPEWGERVVATVETTVDADAVRAFLKTRLARHKVPTRIDVVEGRVISPNRAEPP